MPKHRISLYGNNDGYFTPDLGTVKNANCGICGKQMNVKRNVLGPTGWAEAMAKRKHRYDSFTCPYYEKDWHKKIINLINEARNTSSSNIIKIIEKEIYKILRTKKVPK